MITLFSQLDPRWKNVRIGASPVNIGEDGCVITDICMVSSYFQGLRTGNMNGVITPPQIAEHQGWFDRTGRIYEGIVQVPFTRFVKRLHGYSPASIAASVKGPDTAVLLNVLNGRHWVLAVEPNGRDWMAIDPLGGIRINAMAKYGSIVGSMHFALK